MKDTKQKDILKFIFIILPGFAIFFTAVLAIIIDAIPILEASLLAIGISVLTRTKVL